MVVNSIGFHWHYLTVPLGIVANLVSAFTSIAIIRLQRRISRIESKK